MIGLIIWITVLSIGLGLMMYVGLFGLTSGLPVPLIAVLAIASAAAVPAVVVAGVLSPSHGLIVESIYAYAWGLVFYFLIQRFSAAADMPMMVRDRRWMYPLLNLALLASCVASFVRSLPWYWGFLPPLLWIVLGFICAELAIYRVLKRFKAVQEMDRASAKMIVNQNQGRASVFHPNRYPFP